MSDRCPRCGRQITRSPTRPGIEYGHERGNAHGERCPRWPDAVDPSGPGLGAFADLEVDDV